MEPPKATVYPYRVLLTAAVIAISYLATTSRHIPIAGDISDKINHFSAFFVLSLLVDFSFPDTGYNLAKALPLLGYGFAIEIVQYFLPHRSFSLYDLGVDAIGLLAYWRVVPVLRHVPVLRGRWTKRSL